MIFVEITPRVGTITSDKDGIRMVFAIAEGRVLSVILHENMIDLMAHEIVRHKTREAA